MNDKVKRTGKIFLCALVLAVAGRPAVVGASTVLNSPAYPSLGAFSHTLFQAPSTVSIHRVKPQSSHEHSKLNFLPKNTVGLYHFTPQVAKFHFLSGSGQSATASSVIRGTPSQNFLVLRI